MNKNAKLTYQEANVTVTESDEVSLNIFGWSKGYGHP